MSKAKKIEKTNFPNLKTVGFIFKKRVPDGWLDLGKQRPTAEVGGIRSVVSYHKLCGDTVNIGKENGVPFQFCSRCLIKLK